MVLGQEAPLREPLRLRQEPRRIGGNRMFWRGRDVVAKPLRFGRNCHGVDKCKASFLP